MAGDIQGVTKHGFRRVYRMLCFMAWCDEDLAESERKLLEQFRERFNLGDVEAALLETEGKRGVALELGSREAELDLLVDSVIDVALADGLLALDEQSRLLRLGKELGLPGGTMVRRVKRRVKQRGLTIAIEHWEEDDDDDDEE